MRIEALDHLVLTVRDLEATVAFYERLGLAHEVTPDGRHALRRRTKAQMRNRMAASYARIESASL